jgi:hypothetical protein
MRSQVLFTLRSCDSQGLNFLDISDHFKFSIILKYISITIEM